MPYSQQQCNKNHSAVNSLSVLHFPCKVYAPQWSFSIILLATTGRYILGAITTFAMCYWCLPSCYCPWPVPNFQPT